MQWGYEKFHSHFKCTTSRYPNTSIGKVSFLVWFFWGSLNVKPQRGGIWMSRDSLKIGFFLPTIPNKGHPEWQLVACLSTASTLWSNKIRRSASCNTIIPRHRKGTMWAITRLQGGIIRIRHKNDTNQLQTWHIYIIESYTYTIPATSYTIGFI